MTDSIMLFKALSDKSRLRILSNLAEGPMYVELLSERLNLSPSTVSFHLKKLEQCGLVTPSKQQYYVVFSLNTDILNNTLMDYISIDEIDTKSQNLREDAYRKEVIHIYFYEYDYGRLASIPVQKKRKQIVLEEITSRFDSTKSYSESDINSRLAFYFNDFEKLKQELILNKLLSFDGNFFIFTLI